MSKITPFLWFNTNGEEAMKFYTSVFKESSMSSTMPGPDGKLMGGSFVLNGQEFMFLNGGPTYKFNEAVSFFIKCKNQNEVDYYWNALTADGGEESMCGWLKDKYGVSWQVIPDALSEYIGDSDSEKSGRALQAMLKMKKIDVAELKKAHDGA